MAEQAALQAVHSGFESRRPFQNFAGVAKWSKAPACKAVIIGSNPITCSFEFGMRSEECGVSGIPHSSLLTPHSLCGS